MQMLREWIITILSVIIFIAFIEILIPNSKNKKYINVVIGFLIMTVILNPVIKMLNSGVNLSENILQASNQIEQMTMQNRIASVENEQKESILSLYKEEIRKQVKERVERAVGKTVAEVSLSIDEKEGETFGFINEIHVIMKNKKAEPQEKNKIEPVQINVVLNNKNHNTAEVSSIWLNKKDKIKKDLSHFYKVKEENIHISVTE